MALVGIRMSLWLSSLLLIAYADELLLQHKSVGFPKLPAQMDIL